MAYEPTPAFRVAPAETALAAPPAQGFSPDFYARENAHFARKLAADDAARAAAEPVEMIALASFTIVTNGGTRVVKAGEAVTISAFDDRRFAGRLRRKSLDAPTASPGR